MKTNLKPIVLAVAGVFTLAGSAFAADVAVVNKIEVIGITPLHSSGTPINDVPSNVQVVKGEDLVNQQSLGLADYMNNNMVGVNVNETQNNPFQMDVNYHGFTASPLLGTPQGLSVYMDGVRINEPFGDTVNWDLIPKNAIAGINLMPGSNPLFGLNTLGGALSVQTKSGDLFPGGSAQVYGGSWGRRAAEAEYGGSTENGFNYYVAANYFKEDGWRDASSTDVRQFFTKLGWKGEKTDFNLSLALADNNMNGNGLTPESMLQSLGRSSVYTQPDNTKNKLGFLTAQFNHWFNDNLAFNSVAYYRNVRTKTYNADINDGYDPAGGNANQGVINRTGAIQQSYGLTGQLNWTVDRNQLIVGAGYERALIKFNQTEQEFEEFNSARGVDFAQHIDDEALVTNIKSKTHTWSLFGTDTYKLTDKVGLTASGRYNRTHVDTHDFDPGAALTATHTFQRFNPAIGMTYTPVESLNFFAGYNEGSRAPSAIELGCADPNNPCKLPNAMQGDPPLKQVVARTFEGGVRGRLGSDTKWSAALYTTENDNDIQFIASSASGAGYFQNVGKTRRSGLDLGLNSQMDKLRWMIGYSYVDATYESQFEIANAVNSASNGTTITVNKGNQIVGIPEHQFKLRGEYSVLPNWTVGATAVAFSDQYVRGNENNADPNGKVAGYAIMNLDTRYSFGNSGWQAFAKVNNVFDHEYSTGGVLMHNVFGSNGAWGLGPTDQVDDAPVAKAVAPGAPRAGWVGLRYEFGGAKKSVSTDRD
jgi:outer membrane receptor protein involved in Fe transport